ncbi:MAG: aminotransferase class IV [Gaiellaceae bacterium]
MTTLALAVLGRGLVDPAEPVLRADDEALLRGRAAFETTRVYGGRPFKLDEHLVRLATSAARIELPQPDSDAFRELVADALVGIEDASLRLVWTPGPSDTDRPVGLVIVGAIPADYEELRARGMRVVALQIGVPHELRAKAPWILGGVKSTSYAVNMAATAEAKHRGADDAIFLAEGDVVLEGPKTNVWWRNEQTLFTPSLETGILAGITRDFVIETAPGLGYEIAEGVYTRAELATAEEAFTSSSVRELMPVVSLDGSPIGDGRPGSAQAALQDALRRAAGAR